MTGDLYRSNLDLIEIVLNQTRSLWRRWQREDVREAAMDGYGEALARYDPSKGASFRTFASYRVRGAILDFIRAEARYESIKDTCAEWKMFRKPEHFTEPEYCLDPQAFRRGMMADMKL
jgi:DNA-directed RNA polymerase specialized sigma subunit